jgi:5-methylthioadenosine/S-adenosylhomocysteine deaminase
VKLILSRACVVTVNAADDILAPGSVLVEGDRITAIGSLGELQASAPDAEVIDCAGQILIPGMVNTHTHLFQAQAMTWS